MIKCHALFRKGVHGWRLERCAPIAAEIAETQSVLDIRLASTNGGLFLTVPDDAGGRLEARTVNGSVRTDLPVTVRGGSSRRSLNGELNGGGDGRIELKTTNGNIRIH